MEQVSYLEGRIESSTAKYAEDLCHATYEAKKTLAVSYLDVLVSLMDKWERKKVSADCEILLREVMSNIDLLF